MAVAFQILQHNKFWYFNQLVFSADLVVYSQHSDRILKTIILLSNLYYKSHHIQKLMFLILSAVVFGQSI